MPTDQAPVTREHRQAAAEALLGDVGMRYIKLEYPWHLEQWVQDGVDEPLSRVEALRSGQLIRTAQAIANEGAKLTALQARVRECITELRATGGDPNVLGWLERGLAESEKAGANG